MLVIPRSLQRKVIQIAHEGHQVIVRTKQLLQEKVYFPNIDKLVEETCQLSNNRKKITWKRLSSTSEKLI